MISILQQGDKIYIDKWKLDYIIGIDEAGRGPLAGPVIASAIALSPELLSQSIWYQEPLQYIQDSKKVTAKRRQAIYDAIQGQYTIGVGIISAQIIDKINILEATKLAWLQALDECLLQLPLDAHIGILIDGNIAPAGIEYPHMPIIKGDNKHLSIAIASIYAKVTRDTMMQEYHNQYPQYGFAQHKGYGTAHHIQAIKEHTLSDIHRISFCKSII